MEDREELWFILKGLFYRGGAPNLFTNSFKIKLSSTLMVTFTFFFIYFVGNLLRLTW